MTTLVENETAGLRILPHGKPLNKKVHAAGLGAVAGGSGLAGVAIWIASLYGVTMPAEVAAAIAGAVSGITAWVSAYIRTPTEVVEPSGSAVTAGVTPAAAPLDVDLHVDLDGLTLTQRKNGKAQKELPKKAG